jgi:hypothetical protein
VNTAGNQSTTGDLLGGDMYASNGTSKVLEAGTDGTDAIFFGAVTGGVSGNAATATALETARTLGGVSFDGTANIDLPGVNTAGNQSTSGNAATATALETARTLGGVSFDGTANVDLPGVNTAGNQSTSGNAATATALETARTLGGVSFDGTANVDLPGVNTAGNQSTSGNAATATALETARTLGGVSFDGTANVDLPGVNTAGNQSTTGDLLGGDMYASNGTSKVLEAGTDGTDATFTGAVTGTVSSIANHDTDDLTEQVGATNLFFTDARSRAAVSATDAGGDGSFSYNSTSGVMTYTGPSAAETRAHFTAGTGVTITSGAVAIGQAVATTDAVTFASATTTGNATVGGTLDVTDAAELESTLGVDGNLRVGASGASKFSVDAASGAITTSGDLAMTNGTIVAGALQVSGSTTLNTADVSTMSVSTTLTVPTPSFGAAAANKSYVDSHAATLPQAYSYTSNESYTGLGADLDANGVTIWIFGANLAAGTYKLHLDGAEVAVTVSNVSATSVAFILTEADIAGLTTRTGLLAPQLSIDGIATGLNIFVNL